MLSNLPENFRQERLLSVLLLVIILFSIGNYLVNGLYAGIRYKGQDFVGYYANGKMLMQGVNIHNYEEWKKGVQSLELTRDGKILERATRSDYPPFWYLVMSVFSPLKWQNAFVVWILINQIFLLLLILLLFRYFDIKTFSVEAALMLFVMLNYYPLFYTLMEGQVNILLLLMLISAFWFFKKRIDWLAGLMLGLATGIKIVPAIILFYFLWKGHWKVVIFGVLGFLGTLLITALGAGSEIVVSYYTGQLFKYGASTNPDIFNQSINGFWSRLLTQIQYANGGMAAPGFANIMIKITSIATLIISLSFTRGKFERCGQSWNIGLAIFVLTMMMVSAWTMEHHFINLYIPFFVVFIGYFRFKNISLSSILIFILCYGLFAFNLPYTTEKFNSGVLILVKSLKFYPLLVMWGLLCFELKRLRMV